MTGKRAKTPERSLAIARLCDRVGTSVPEDAVTLCVNQLLDAYWAEAEAGGLIVNVDKVAALAGITVQGLATGPGIQEQGECRSTLARSADGRLVATPFGIHASSVWRTYLAHEIGHSFFWEQRSGIPLRPAGIPPDRYEERLCDLAGRQILMPQRTFRLAATGALRTPAALIQHLSSLFGVSPWYVVNRLADLPPLWRRSGIGVVGCWRTGSVAARTFSAEPTWIFPRPETGRQRAIALRRLRMATEGIRSKDVFWACGRETSIAIATRGR